MSQGFRYEPGMLRRDRGVPRPRLTRALRERFERRLTLVVGAAGYGKTTALTNAIESNRLDPVGIDIWLAATEDDVDPTSLAQGLAGAFGLDIAGDEESVVETIVNEVWRRAPDDIALIVDDAHLLSSEASLAIIDGLIKQLPRNGHVVLGCRTMPDLAIARLRAHGEVLELSEADLSFSDGELNSLVDLHDGAVGGTADAGQAEPALPRHPALADLQLSAGLAAGVDFLWEEILHELSPEHQTALVRSSVVEQLDDALALALSGLEFSADELVGDLPLVESFTNGSYRLHALLRQALAHRMNDDDRAKAARIAADVEAERGRVGVAVRLLAQGGDTTAAIAMARTYVVLPTLHTPLHEVIAVRKVVDSISGSSPLAQLLAAHCLLGAASREALRQFEDAIELANTEEDDEVETVAIHRAIQIYYTLSKFPPRPYVQRLTELEATVPFASGLSAHIRAAESRFSGDSQTSRRELEKFDVLDSVNQMVMRAEHLCDLGRPDEVAAGLTPDDLGRLPEGTEIFIAFAMWLRGEALPELALEIVQGMVDETLSRRIPQTNVAQLSVASVIASTAGRDDLAQQWITEAEHFAALDPAARIAAYTRLPAAVAAASVGDDSQAIEFLHAALRDVPMGAWPERPYLLALPLFYVLIPGTRVALDRAVFGQDLTDALDAARCLVTLREEGQSSEAANIAWARASLLRVHIVPAHLVELGAAAAALGNETAAALIETIPGYTSLLHEVHKRTAGVTKRWISDRLKSLPPEPTHTVAIKTLGTLQLLRDGEVVTDGDWVRRARVRELLAYLVEHRRCTRAELADALWPELAEDKAIGNLRVTLSYLQKVLEPDRPKSVAPVFVQTEGEQLVLAGHVQLDIDTFDEIVHRAQREDRAGAPAEARDLYGSALELVNGEYLSEFDTDWSFASRLRVQTLALSATCRIGELTLARGEPEQAMPWAIRARKISDLNERAGRLFISCLAAADDRAAALSAAAELTGKLESEGLDPEAETTSLIARLTNR